MAVMYSVKINHSKVGTEPTYTHFIGATKSLKRRIFRLVKIYDGGTKDS